MRKIAAALLGLSGLLSVGCLNVEQTLTLERNLSGKGGFSMKVDMEPLIPFMARMERQMSGKTGEPTAAELAEARKEFLASVKTKGGAAEFEKEKKEFERTLPAGVTLLAATAQQDGLAIAVNMLFGFDRVSALSQIKFPKQQGGPGGRTGQSGRIALRHASSR